jgi:OPA family glycerol-3-phosphate transporter-like MFS transporter
MFRKLNIGPILAVLGMAFMLFGPFGEGFAQTGEGTGEESAAMAAADGSGEAAAAVAVADGSGEAAAAVAVADASEEAAAAVAAAVGSGEASEGTGEAAEAASHGDDDKKGFFGRLWPIALLLLVIITVLSRLPKVEGVDHDQKFRRRRIMNWLPLGLTYAFLYMGRYNLKVSKFAFEEIPDASGGALMGNADFGVIFTAGVVVYGCSFLINGPLTDRMGGRFSILMGAGGSAVMNGLMGFAAWSLLNDGPMADFIAANFVLVYSLMYGVNMYFQSFGAVAIVKCNAPWFHVRERGVFGAIFGILISLGVYFAFDWGYMILTSEWINFESWGLIWVFFTPAILLLIFWVIDFFIVKNTPDEAGLDDFDTADASSGDEGPQKRAVDVFKMMLTNPVILTIAAVEFCSGFLRQAIMQWFRTFAKQTNGFLDLKGSFIYENWGMCLCCAGILGGVFAGIISDRVFQSRRGPVAGILYALMFISAITLTFTYDTTMVGLLVLLMSMCVIGVHGMLSGTASMDFGGKKNVGIAVGIIDGFVYLGTGVMSMTYAWVLPSEHLAGGSLVGQVKDPENWLGWPVAMIPFALIGLILALGLWRAKPREIPKPLFKGQSKLQWVAAVIVLVAGFVVLNGVKGSRDADAELFWDARTRACESEEGVCQLTDAIALAIDGGDCEAALAAVATIETEAQSSDALTAFTGATRALCAP